MKLLLFYLLIFIKYLKINTQTCVFVLHLLNLKRFHFSKIKIKILVYPTKKSNFLVLFCSKLSESKFFGCAPFGYLYLFFFFIIVSFAFHRISSGFQRQDSNPRPLCCKSSPLNTNHGFSPQTIIV